MRLLSPKEIKATRASAEEGLTKRINDADKVLSKKVKDLSKIDDALKSSKEKADKYVAELQSYILELERRRDELERSIDSTSYKKKLADVQEKETQLALIDQGLKNQFNLLANRSAEVENWEKLLHERYESLNERERRLKDSELTLREEFSRVDTSREAIQREMLASQRLRESAEELKSQVSKILEEVTSKSKALDMERSVLMDFVEREKRQVANDRIALKDGYETLAKAREEIYKRKT